MGKVKGALSDDVRQLKIKHLRIELGFREADKPVPIEEQYIKRLNRATRRRLKIKGKFNNG